MEAEELQNALNQPPDGAAAAAAAGGGDPADTGTGGGSSNENGASESATQTTQAGWGLMIGKSDRSRTPATAARCFFCLEYRVVFTQLAWRAPLKTCQYNS